MTVEAHTYRYHSISWCWSLWKTECTCHLTLERALTSREQPKRDWDMRFPLRKKKSDLHNEANIFSSLGSGMNGCDSGDQKGKIFFSFLECQKSLKSFASAVTELCHAPLLIWPCENAPTPPEGLVPLSTTAGVWNLHRSPGEQNVTSNVLQQQHEDECDKWSKENK